MLSPVNNQGEAAIASFCALSLTCTRLPEGFAVPFHRSSLPRRRHTGILGMAVSVRFTHAQLPVLPTVIPHALIRKSIKLIGSPNWMVASTLLSDHSSISRLNRCLFMSPQESWHTASHGDTSPPTVTPHSNNRNKAAHHGTPVTGIWLLDTAHTSNPQAHIQRWMWLLVSTNPSAGDRADPGGSGAH